MISRRLLLRWGVPFAFWSIPAALLTVLTASERQVSLLRAFVEQGAVWYYWALVTPLVLALARRYPIEPPRTVRGLLVHMPAGVLAGCIFGLVYGLYLTALGAIPDEVTSLRSFILKGMIFWTFFGLVFYTTIVSIGFALAYQERLRERELASSRLEARLVEAQLNTLRVQLQPHFLFNTLNTIAMYVRDGDRTTSIRLLTRLSELLRHLLDAGHAQEVPLQMELEHLKRYLDIEGSRFSDRLRVTIDVPGELQDAFVPNLILQPLVENAIRHGVAARAAASSVELVARRENGRLSLTLRNDGPALPNGWSLAETTGIGLRNTALRLQHLYGDQAALNVRNATGGVSVEVDLPYRTTPVTDG
jgi:two-component sensor histidine kinase